MSTIRLSPSGREVEAQPGDTVLAALERQGYALPNNCRAGACGDCRTRVVSGQFDQGIVLSMALTDQDRRDGWGLMCMATPLSDVLEIEFGTADAQPMLFPPRTGVPFVVVDRIARTPTIVELRLRPVGDPLRYWPGQYVLLGDPSQGATPRSYSIANAPLLDGEIRLLISRVPDGATSGWIHGRLETGDVVAIDGPYGTFLGDPATDTAVLCMAAGSGLAPILALTDAALRRGFPHPVTLVFSARTDDDHFAEGQFAWWQASYPNFRSIVTYTGSDGGSHTKDHHGRIPAILDDLVGSLANTSVFVAGSPEFVDDCVAAARQLGAHEDLIYTEGFVSQALPETPPADRLQRAAK